jgi:uncharacterized protein
MPKPKFKILSIDGGGIRGVIPCYILAFIESQIGHPLSKVFDLIAGTSTGGIITLGLSTNNPKTNRAFKASEMLALYQENGEKIFEKRQSDWVSWAGSITNISELMTRKPYGSENIEAMLDTYFGNTQLSDTLTEVLVTSYEINKENPFYFLSRLAKINPKENKALKEIARSTSAAPTYFEPKLLNYDASQNLALVDGGVFANNPAILAYSEAKELWKSNDLRKAKGFEPVVLADDNDLPFYMLSIGTGHSPNPIKLEDAQKWRTHHWIEPLLTNIFMQSVSASTHYTMQHLLPPYTDGTLRYQRIDMQLPKECSEMDNASPENIQQLIAIADKYIEDNEANLLKICHLLK